MGLPFREGWSQRTLDDGAGNEPRIPP